MLASARQTLLAYCELHGRAALVGEFLTMAIAVVALWIAAIGFSLLESIA